MKNYIFFLGILILGNISGCTKPEDDPCSEKLVYNLIPQKVQTYFPYSLGQKLKFNKYEDSVFIKEINFIIDTIGLTQTSIYTQGQMTCGQVDYYDIYNINLHNLTDTLEDIKIKLVGSNSDRYTELTVIYKTTKYGAKYRADRFSDFVLYGVNHQGEISNFTRFGFNYGNTHVTYPNGLISRLYLNSDYGAIGLEYNYFKDFLILKP